jgi:hypothetical protein
VLEDDTSFYSRRAAEEQRAAARAIQPTAKARHRALARLFRSRACRSDSPPTPELDAAE